MGPLDLLLHLLNFAAPALAVGLGVALAARVLRLDRSGWRWWGAAALNSAAGLAALGAGLAWFRQDGRIASYAAMALAIATAQWLAGRGWKR